MSEKGTSLPTVNFLTSIKSKTENSHKKLESLPLSGSILSPKMKISEYIQYLSLMHDVHKNAEEVIFPIISFIDDLDQRKKTHLIENDLLYLNHNKPESTEVFNSAHFSEPFALGILYVIEGSSLGGRFILKNVSTVPGLDEEQGVSYFMGYGEKTGSKWKAFLNFLEEYEQNYECGDAIIEGAVFAFDSIYNHFRSAQ